MNLIDEPLRGRAWALVALLVVAALLSACGGESEDAPALSSPPTRTPAPATLTPAPDDSIAALEIISLADGVQTFLDEAADASPLDRPVLFDQHVFAPHPECFPDAFYTGSQPLELMDFNLVSLDLAILQASVEMFPEAQLRESIETTIAAAADDLPLDAPFRVCIFPSPAWRPPEDLPNGGLNVETFSDDVIIAWCGGGAVCLDAAPQEIAFAYAYAEQLQHGDFTVTNMTLLDWALFPARAADFARRSVPDARFPWSGAELDPAVEADVWSRMQTSLDVTYTDYPDYRKIERFVYGRDSEDYPRWGGVIIAGHIVDAYREAHPLTTPADLLALPTREMLAQSAYAP